jgi:hypothetical protein
MSAHRLLVVVGVALLGAGACGGGGGARHPRPTRTAAPASGGRAAAAVAWTDAAVLQRLAGQRIRVGGRAVQIDPSTVTCVGEGTATTRDGRPAWTGFRCVQPTFPPGAVAGPDAIFEVRPTGERTFAVVDARLSHY